MFLFIDFTRIAFSWFPVNTVHVLDLYAVPHFIQFETIIITPCNFNSMTENVYTDKNKWPTLHICSDSSVIAGV